MPGEKNEQIQNFCVSWIQVPGGPVIPLHRFASTVFSSFIPEERTPHLKSQPLVRYMALMKSFSFPSVYLHCTCHHSTWVLIYYTCRESSYVFVMQRRSGRFRFGRGSQESCDAVRLSIQN